MRKLLKITGIALALILVLLILTGFIGYSRMAYKASNNYSKLGEKAEHLDHNGFAFRDLNKNGKLDIYEDSRESIDDRVNDLISRMSLEEKAGTMFVSMIGMTPDGIPIDKPFFTSNPLDVMIDFSVAFQF